MVYLQENMGIIYRQIQTLSSPNYELRRVI